MTRRITEIIADVQREDDRAQNWWALNTFFRNPETREIAGKQFQKMFLEKFQKGPSKMPSCFEKDTVKFIWCLFGAFCHEPSRVGYPAGKEAPFHRHDSDNELRQVVTVGGPQLYIDDQEAGPPRDHLVSRATVTFQAQLVDPKAGEKAGWDWCCKSRWPQKLRKHEGDCLERLQGCLSGLGSGEGLRYSPEATHRCPRSEDVSRCIEVGDGE